MKNFVKNVGFICTQCKKIVTDGIKHDNEEDLCDQCKIRILEEKLNELQKADSCRGWKLENDKIIYYCNIFSDYKKERSLKEVVEDLNQMTKESDRTWEIMGLYQGLKNELVEREKKFTDALIEQEKASEKQLKKQASIHYKHLKEMEQNKISFCIKKLEIIKDEIDNNAYFDYEHECNVVESYPLWSFVDTLIEELKKEIK